MLRSPKCRFRILRWVLADMMEAQNIGLIRLERAQRAGSEGDDVARSNIVRAKVPRFDSGDELFEGRRTVDDRGIDTPEEREATGDEVVAGDGDNRNRRTIL